MIELDLAYTPATTLASMIARRDVSPVEVVENALARIEQVNPQLNCFCFVWADEARTDARRATAVIARGGAFGPLHGVPVALKDTTPTAGHRTTLGSFTHEHWVPDHDAYIVKALRRAGAIIVGKTTTPEFAHTLLTDSPLWGVTRNPWNLAKTPGGSSGGSAAAVASGCVSLAEGTDMGGSVRIPAAWCGIAGLKPGFGRIPMDVLPGLFDLMSHHGPLARTVDDAALFLTATQGPDDADILSVPCPVDVRIPLPSSVTGMRLALSVNLGIWAIDPTVERAVRHAADALRAAGATVEEVGVSVTTRDEEVWGDLWGVFMATYYGHFLDEYRTKMDPDVVQLIERGRSLSAVQLKTLELDRTALWRRFAAVFAEYDALLCPSMSTGPSPASKAERATHEANRPGADVADDGRYHAADMTGVFNLIPPCPALSVPCGFDDDGMPIGLQIVGRRWRDDTVLQIGRAAELALPDALRRPPI